MTPLMSRLAALGLLMAVVFLAIFGAALPLAERWRTAGDDAAALEEQLDRFRTRLADTPQRAALKVADRALLEAPSEALAAGVLHSLVEAAVQSAGGRLESIRSDGGATLDEGRTAQISIDVTTTAAGLQRLLHRIELGQPYLFIDRLDVRRAVRSRDEAGDKLSVRLRIFGLYSGPAG